MMTEKQEKKERKSHLKADIFKENFKESKFHLKNWIVDISSLTDLE
jgi:hypothetical protein